MLPVVHSASSVLLRMGWICSSHLNWTWSDGKVMGGDGKVLVVTGGVCSDGSEGEMKGEVLGVMGRVGSDGSADGSEGSDGK